MRRASTIKASSTRNVCAFCATRQLVAASASQRRHLNSSSKAPQYASEAQVYREEKAPARPLTQLEKMQQLARQRYAAPPPPPPPRQQQQPQQSQTAFPPQRPQSQHPFPQQRPQSQYTPPPRQPPRQSQYGMSQAESQRAPLQSQFTQPQTQRSPWQRPSPPTSDGPRPRTANPQSRYNVNMDSRPPMMDTPQFGTAGLQRGRNDFNNAPAPRAAELGSDNAQRSFTPRADIYGRDNVQRPIAPRNDIFGRNDAQQPSTPRASEFGEQKQQPRAARPAVVRPKLDQDELARLLGGNSQFTKRDAPSSATPFSRETRTQLKCFNCGEMGHTSYQCPSKPTVRQPSSENYQQAQTPRYQESTADAAEAWVRKQGAKGESGEQSTYVEQEGRKKDEVSERRRARFDMGDAVTETKNRYNEPERRRGTFDKRSRGRVMRQEDEDESFVEKAERKRDRKAAKKIALLLEKPEPTRILIPEYISVANLAGLLRLRVEDFVQKLTELGFEEVQNDHILNAEHAGLIAQEYNFEPIVQVEGEDGDLYAAEPLSPEEYVQLPTRPPVVTIMGHVDHGKTTVLDYIRSTTVAAGEFGGITQHIGAFSVAMSSGKKITFLDTPGHAAFETMRARGANVTDIVVLVVAADDSVMPQTVEAIKHAQAARVPIIVAINKMDKPQADPEKVKLDLGRYGIDVEDFGGDVQTVCVSGKTGQGITDLEEAITLQSEVLDHRADPAMAVEGWVLEGTTKNRGRVATVLVRSGTLRRGDVLVAGTTWARVRTLRNEAGVVVEEASPGMPVEVDGWREQPIAGDEVLQCADEQQATDVADLRVEKVERIQMAVDMDAINESRRLETERREAEEAAAKAAEAGEDALPEEVKESGPEVVSFIVKGDVSGSVEAVIDSISAIGNGEVGVRVLRFGVGPPSEFDVEHAAAAKGHIINFNTPIQSHILAACEEKGVQILDSNIIYRVVENVKALLSEKLPPKITQRVTGEAEIAAVFEIGIGGRKKLKVAGSKVRNGMVEKGGKAKVLRGEDVVFDGVVSSLKNQKKDAEQMRKDTECGIAFENWEEFQVGDRVQCYEEKSEKRSL